MEWKPSIKIVPKAPFTEMSENRSMRKLVEDITIVKPKIERMHLMGRRGHSTVQQERRPEILRQSESHAVISGNKSQEKLNGSALDGTYG